MTARESRLGRFVSALAARPASTATAVPVPTRTRLAAALAARPVTARSAAPLPHPDGGDGDGDGKLTHRVKTVLAGVLGITTDQLRVDADGDVGIRAGSAMIFVRAQDDPPLVDVFSPLLTGVAPTESLYRRLSDLTNGLVIGRVYCTGDTVWASIPVFGQDFAPTHLLLALRAMIALADDLDDQLRREFGGSRFFGPESSGLVAVPDPTGYLRDLDRAGANGAGSVLVDLLADRGRTQELRVRAEHGDWHAAARLAALLAERGSADEAERYWRIATEQGDARARDELAALLAARGRHDEAIDLLRQAVDGGDRRPLAMLLTLLAERGLVDEAVALLRGRAAGRD
ncbi:T3SS (YopN, CesT) and YbjN peptide-binding chaperone 1 [Micromonospora sp. CPCC 205561]|uniref:T3SS (YopN, CesT) and YbjN peptide-binding chaperone 1 n=1 Tax=Micromonospora sp. CPCC 205561 TaxID=3122407 RepID=UPI003FA5E6F6